MPFNITCIRCGGKIATVEKNKVRDWVQTHDVEVCNDCIKKEENLRSFFDKQKNGYSKKLNVICDEAIAQLNNEIKELNAEHRATD